MSRQATSLKTDSNAPHIGVNPESRAAVAKELSAFLASTYSLYLKSLYYHWNVTGIHFHSLHEMFEQQYQDLHTAGDTIAERIRALGHKTPGTFHEFTRLSQVNEDKELPQNAEKMIANLLADNEACSNHAREVLEVAEEHGDEVTVDMMVARMAVHDETAWMLRALTE